METEILQPELPSEFVEQIYGVLNEKGDGGSIEVTADAACRIAVEHSDEFLSYLEMLDVPGGQEPFSVFVRQVADEVERVLWGRRVTA